MLRFPLAAAFAVTIPLPALAGSITVSDTTDIVAYSESAPASYYSGSNPYVAPTAIGADFTTKSLTLQATALAGGNVSVDFSYVTQFPGSETVGSENVAFADIFLRPDQGGNPSSPFTYSISLGDQSANGGLAAGFYQIGADATSQQIWSGRPGYIYGGAYTNTAQFQPGQAGYEAYAAPTAITAGKRLGDAAITLSAMGQGWYQLDASIVMTAQQAALFNQGFDVFWGTGDCANGAFLADLQTLPVRGLSVMEPASFLLLASFIGISRIAGLKATSRRHGAAT